MKALELAETMEWSWPVSRHIHDKAAAELRRLAAVEAELDRIKALKPVAWRSSMGHGVTLKESITDDQKALTWDGKPMWQPLIALGSKTS